MLKWRLLHMWSCSVWSLLTAARLQCRSSHTVCSGPQMTMCCIVTQRQSQLNSLLAALETCPVVTTRSGNESVFISAFHSYTLIDTETGWPCHLGWSHGINKHLLQHCYILQYDMLNHIYGNQTVVQNNDLYFSVVLQGKQNKLFWAIRDLDRSYFMWPAHSVPRHAWVPSLIRFWSNNWFMF